MSRPVTRAHAAAVLLTGLAVLAAVILLAPALGSTRIDLMAAVRGESPHAEILFHARLPRVLLAALAGGALSVAGLLFQALVRDALADPYTLGVSAGASLGAVLALCLHAPGISAWAFAGAGLTLLTVLWISTRGVRMSSFTLLLAGVTVNSICMAVLLLLHSFANFSQSFAIMRWLMGGIEPLDYSTVALAAAAILPAVSLVFLRSGDWNLLAVGEEWAEARGAPVRRLLLTGLLTGAWLTGIITSLTGPIGFLGLIVPHALRLRLGADHRVLVPAAFTGVRCSWCYAIRAPGHCLRRRKSRWVRSQRWRVVPASSGCCAAVSLYSRVARSQLWLACGHRAGPGDDYRPAAECGCRS